jgi:hypothetical protein
MSRPHLRKQVGDSGHKHLRTSCKRKGFACTEDDTLPKPPPLFARSIPMPAHTVSPSQAAAALKAYFSRQGLELAWCTAREAVAVTRGHTTWSSLISSAPGATTAVTTSSRKPATARTLAAPTTAGSSMFRTVAWSFRPQPSSRQGTALDGTPISPGSPERALGIIRTRPPTDEPRRRRARGASGQLGRVRT